MKTRTKPQRVNLFTLVIIIGAVLLPGNISAQELTKKWFPGHYIRANRTAPDKPINNFCKNLIAENPGFVGFGIEFDWRDLETAFGVYDFSQIVADLDYVHSIGKKATLMINDRFYYRNETSTCGDQIPVPDYMLHDPIYEGGYFQSIDPGRCKQVPKYFLRPVTERLVALWVALAEVIDSHPALAYVSTQESAIPNMQGIEGFNSTTYFNNFMYLNSAIADAFPNTIFTPMLNWAGPLTAGQIEELMVHLATVSKTGITDPGVLKKHSVYDKPFAKYWKRYKGIIPFAACTEDQDYTVELGAASARAVYDFAIDTVGLNFHVWTIVKEDKPNINFHFWDVIDVLNEENFRINTTPPSNLLRTGVSTKQSISGKYSIYPNPVNDILQLSLNSDHPDVNYTCQLLDITGKILESQVILNSSSQIPTSKLVKGTYFLRITDDNMNTEILKFCKI